MNKTLFLKHKAVTIFFILSTAIAVSAVIIGSKYKLLMSLVSNSSGCVCSNVYKISNAAAGQSMSGSIKNDKFKNLSGFSDNIEAISKAAPASTISNAYVFPNPYKPNSPGSKYYAENMRFTNLTADVRIKVFNIAGEQVASLHKTDTSVDYYDWNGTGDSGQKLASGVYIFIARSSSGQTKKGKFAIIK